MKSNKFDGNKKNIKFTVLQICNELKLTGYNRKIVIKKFKDDSFSKDKWLKKIKNIGLNF